MYIYFYKHSIVHVLKQILPGDNPYHSSTLLVQHWQVSEVHQSKSVENLLQFVFLKDRVWPALVVGSQINHFFSIVFNGKVNALIVHSSWKECSIKHLPWQWPVIVLQVLLIWVLPSVLLLFVFFELLVLSSSSFLLLYLTLDARLDLDP